MTQITSTKYKLLIELINDSSNDKRHYDVASVIYFKNIPDDFQDKVTTNTKIYKFVYDHNNNKLDIIYEHKSNKYCATIIKIIKLITKKTLQEMMESEDLILQNMAKKA